MNSKLTPDIRLNVKSFSRICISRSSSAHRHGDDQKIDAHAAAKAGEFFKRAQLRDAGFAHPDLLILPIIEHAEYLHVVRRVCAKLAYKVVGVLPPPTITVRRTSRPANVSRSMTRIAA